MTPRKSLAVTIEGRRIRLPLLTDAEYDEAEKKSKLGFDVCPTCNGKRIETGEEDHYGWENGQYRYRGEIHECDCKGQMALYRHYLFANIPEQYQRLNWDDYSGDSKVKQDVDTYIDRWPNFRDNGMGVTLYGIGLGTGKTFAATTIAKGVIKRGERVFFTEFRDLKSAYQTLSEDDRQRLDERLREAALLVLDEIWKPQSEAQEGYFETVLESVIRYRTNWNLPTVITTNLLESEFEDHYPRVFSLLRPKQWTMHIEGEDARMDLVAEENIELAANGEKRPIT